MKNAFAALVLLASFASISAQKQPLNYFLPEGEYDRAVPTPEQFLGFQVGEWHVSPDQIVAYAKELDRASDRVSLEIYGYSHEHRPLILLTITSPENHTNLLKIKQLHRSLADPSRSAAVNLDSMPAVIYQGFSVHGNEPSGCNAALLYAYYLAAARGNDVENVLKNTVVLLDPCFNPDGGQRFSTWVNANRSTNLANDPAGREFNEPWPRGRFNHYLFDLNRDWLVAQQPETVGRIRNFQDWLPNILTDHHEMGSNSTFFFQPGVPSRVNSLTPPENQELTKKIGTYHARALDAIGSLYFTEENFDDFYYGKGSTYPDVNGSVGILFEQASSRGHAQETENGVLTFPFTIRNQVVCALSTLRAGYEMRHELNQFLRDFYQNSLKEARADATKAFVFGEKNDPARLSFFVEMLLRQGIDVFRLNEKTTLDGLDFSKETSFVVPLEQPKYRLIRAMFDRQTSFTDSLFYDISAWTLPLAFNLDCSKMDAKAFSTRILGEKITDFERPVGKIVGNESSYAWLFRPDGYFAHAMLDQILKAGLTVKIGTKPFALGGQNWDYGTFVVPVGGQTKSPTDIFWTLKKQAAEWGVDVFGVKTGLTDTGIDLGSQNFIILRRPKVAILSGEGVSPTDAGEAWHLLDVRFQLTPTMLDLSNASFLRNEKFNVVVMPDGSYGSLAADRIREFLMNGGTVVASGGALKWLKTNGLAALEFRNVKTGFSKNRRAYDGLELDNGATAMNGSIFEAEIDRSHPLGFGFSKPKIPIFLSDTLFVETAQNPYATPLVFTKKPLLAGYVHPTAEKMVGGSAAAVICGVGRGKIVAFTGDPNFRAFWFGTNKLFLNAVFFGQIINNEAAERARKK